MTRPAASVIVFSVMLAGMLAAAGCSTDDGATPADSVVPLTTSTTAAPSAPATPVTVKAPCSLLAKADVEKVIQDIGVTSTTVGDAKTDSDSSADYCTFPTRASAGLSSAAGTVSVLAYRSVALGKPTFDNGLKTGQPVSGLADQAYASPTGESITMRLGDTYYAVQANLSFIGDDVPRSQALRTDAALALSKLIASRL